MGLDITAYGKTKIDPNAKLDSDGYAEDYDSYAQPYVHPDFPGRADDLTNRGAYTYEDSMGFRAGSYGGYNSWREQLAKLAGYSLTEYEAWGNKEQCHAAACWNGAEGPFSEMINFADNEGTIGTAVSAKLAKDFAEWDERAKAVDPDRTGWFYARYQDWRRAFEMAADHGFVDFH